MDRATFSKSLSNNLHREGCLSEQEVTPSTVLFKLSSVLTDEKTQQRGFRRAYFDGFQIVAASFIAEFSFRFCCFVFDVKQLLKVKFVVYYIMTKIVATVSGG